MKRLYLPLFSLFILLFSIEGWANSPDSISLSFREQLDCFPQEKLYLHLDKSRYVGGERIWFRAHMVDAASHRPFILSNCLYVELVNPADSLLTRVKLIPTDAAFSGYLDIPVQVPSGSYKIRAYTNYMRNVGEDYFFMRRIMVDELASLNSKKKEKTASGTFNVSFFPEGGKMPGGVFCHVGVKAINEQGYSEDVTGMVVNEEGDTITTFETIYAGMGQLGVQLEVGKKYYAFCRNQSGSEKKLPFPVPEQGVCNLQVRWMRDKLVVSRVKSSDLLDFPEGYSLLVHCRGIVLFSQNWDKNIPYLSFDKNKLPSGILQVLLVNKDKVPVSERLVFCRNDGQAHANIEVDKLDYTKRDFVRTKVNVTDPLGKPLKGNISVSVTDCGDILPDTTITILSSLLLASDLKGYIENPEFYFRGESPLAERSLDCLMLTQGWRRYHVDRILKKQYDKPTKLLELGRYITGNVTYISSNKPLKDIQVNILSPESNFLATTRTDEKGSFKLEGFEHPDSTKYLITALTPNRNELLKLHVDRANYPSITIPWVSTFWSMDSNQKYKQKAYQLRFNDPNIRMIHLDEVIIEGKRKVIGNNRPLHQELSERTVSLETIKRFQPSTMRSLIDLMQGVSFDGERIYLNRLGRQYAARVLVDGMGDSWENLNVHDVERVDLIYPPQANIYGLDTAGGIIAFSTKKGNEEGEKVRFNTYEFTPLGYQTYVEFYTPVYKTTAQKNSSTLDLRTTIYWNPNVTLSGKGEATFDFYSADTSSDYYIVIEGVATNGQLIYGKKRISVNKKKDMR